jgi:thioredoxin reductase (NADPH)
MKVFDVAVIGGGSAGTMAALRTVLNNDECLFFPGTPKDKKKSRALWVRKIENMPARGIEEPNLATLKWISESAFNEKFHWKKNTGVDSLKKNENGLFEIQDSKGESYLVRYVILCTGVMDVQPHIQGSIEAVFDYANAQTIDYCLICDGHHVFKKKTGVIGHTNSAAWVSIMLVERYDLNELTIFTNGENPDFKEDTQKLIDAYGIKIEKAKISSVKGQDKGKILEALELEDGSVFPLEICFVALGMIVYNELAVQLGAKIDDRGFVIGNEAGETSVENLYVAGDLKAQTRKQIYTAWDNAVSAATSVNQKIRIAKRKDKGIT